MTSIWRGLQDVGPEDNPLCAGPSMTIIYGDCGFARMAAVNWQVYASNATMARELAAIFRIDNKTSESCCGVAVSSPNAK